MAKEKNMFYIIKKVSMKTGKPYVALMADLGYRQAIVSCDRLLIMEISGKSGAELEALEKDVIVGVKA